MSLTSAFVSHIHIYEGVMSHTCMQNAIAHEGVMSHTCMQNAIAHVELELYMSSSWVVSVSQVVVRG